MPGGAVKGIEGQAAPVAGHRTADPHYDVLRPGPRHWACVALLLWSLGTGAGARGAERPWGTSLGGRERAATRCLRLSDAGVGRARGQALGRRLGLGPARLSGDGQGADVLVAQGVAFTPGQQEKGQGREHQHGHTGRRPEAQQGVAAGGGPRPGGPGFVLQVSGGQKGQQNARVGQEKYAEAEPEGLLAREKEDDGAQCQAAVETPAGTGVEGVDCLD